MAVADLDLRLRAWVKAQGVSLPARGMPWSLVRIDEAQRLDEVEEWHLSIAQPDEATLTAISVTDVQQATADLAQEAVKAGGAPSTIEAYNDLFYQQAKQAAREFVHIDNVTGTTLYYDIDDWAMVFLRYLHTEALSIGQTAVLARTVPGGPVLPVTHTARHIEDLMQNVLEVGIATMAEFLAFQQSVLAAADVSAVEALPLPSWASLP